MVSSIGEPREHLGSFTTWILCTSAFKELHLVPDISEKSFLSSTVRIWNNPNPTIRNLQTISQLKIKNKG
jgi:hypothetical protein